MEEDKDDEEILEQEFDDVRKKAYDVAKMMLCDRGYGVHETEYDPSEPPSRIVLVLVATNQFDTVNVYMAPEEKQLGKGYVQEILGLNGDDYNHIIIITRCGLTSYVTKEMSAQKKCIVEVFKYDELQAAVGRHSLVPKYSVLPEKMVGDLMRRFRCEKKEDLPRMLSSDPVARYFHFTPGTVLKLVHNIPDWPGSVCYRVVI